MLWLALSSTLPECQRQGGGQEERCSRSQPGGGSAGMAEPEHFLLGLIVLIECPG